MNISPEERRRIDYVNITMHDINTSATNIYECLIDNEPANLKKEIVYLIKRLRDLIRSIEDEQQESDVGHRACIDFCAYPSFGRFTSSHRKSNYLNMLTTLEIIARTATPTKISEVVMLPPINFRFPAVITPLPDSANLSIAP